jgi:hypothetical protein
VLTDAPTSDVQAAPIEPTHAAPARDRRQGRNGFVTPAVLSIPHGLPHKKPDSQPSEGVRRAFNPLSNQ